MAEVTYPSTFLEGLLRQTEIAALPTVIVPKPQLISAGECFFMAQLLDDVARGSRRAFRSDNRDFARKWSQTFLKMGEQFLPHK